MKRRDKLPACPNRVNVETEEIAAKRRGEHKKGQAGSLSLRFWDSDPPDHWSLLTDH
jgi:hypothetical protein